MVMTALVAALSLAALTAVSAQAEIVNLRAGLELTERGTPVSNGGAIYNENFVMNGGCLEASNGKLLNNGDPIDLIQLGALTYDRCEQGSLSGTIKYLGLTDTGTAYVYTEPGLTLTTAGPCVYKFGLLEGNFTIGDETVAYVSGTATGYRAQGSVASCASTMHTGFNVGEYGTDDFLLETGLTSFKLF
jgi:hypothetical protein